jgi:hypothetical protein
MRDDLNVDAGLIHVRQPVAAQMGSASDVQAVANSAGSGGAPPSCATGH